MCPICESNNQDLITKSFLPKYKLCRNCEGLFLIESKKPIYSKNYFREDSSPSFFSKIVSPILNFFATQKINNIKKFAVSKNPKILDYGCGAGKIVEQLSSAGIYINGFEPSSGAIEITKIKKLPIYNSVKKIAGGYNLIMFWHSLEHIDQPFEAIKKIKAYLKKDGKLLIAVPNVDSFEARIFKENWFHFSYPVHRIQFTPKAIKIMLEENGFKIVNIDYINPEYTITGLIQSLLNMFLPKDVLYSVVSHRRQNMKIGTAIFFAVLSVILTFILSPIILIIFLTELIFRKTGAMVVLAKNG